MIDFLNYRNNKKPKKGCFLLSEPFLDDDYFRRAVILLCEHNEDGSFGFVLNNYISIALKELVEDLGDFNAIVSLGGPVAPNNLYYLHTLGNKIPGSKEVLKGVYLGGEFDVLKTLINEKAIKPNQIKFFLGYSGWESKQLDREMREDSWIVTKPSVKLLMGKEDKNLWENVMNKMGGKYSIISKYPINPSLN